MLQVSSLHFFSEVAHTYFLKTTKSEAPHLSVGKRPQNSQEDLRNSREDLYFPFLHCLNLLSINDVMGRGECGLKSIGFILFVLHVFKKSYLGMLLTPSDFSETLKNKGGEKRHFSISVFSEHSRVPT